MASFVFCDLVGSTALHSRLGDDAADELRRRIHTVLHDAVRSHGGTEVKNLGDGLMAAFDSAAEAVSSGIAMQQAVTLLGAVRPDLELGLRVGVSAGEATVEADDWFGTPVVEASRLCDRAEAGQVLISEVAHTLVAARRRHRFRSLGSMQLKGLAAPLAVHEAVWERPAAPSPAAAPEPSAAAPERLLPTRLRRSPPFGFHGREAEQTALARAWKETLAGRSQLVLLSGEAGIGKTALTAELARQVSGDGAVVLFGRCEEDLGVPYEPFVQALGDVPLDEALSPAALAAWARVHGPALLPLLPELVARVSAAGASGLSPGDAEAERYRLFKSVSALLGELAGARPVLVVLDDLHWAAKPTLMLLKYALGALESVPVMFLGTFRESDVSRSHPLAELLPDLRRNAALTRIALTGLDDHEVLALVESASGRALDNRGVALAHAVSRETGGNPFFVAEILRHLVESGALVREGGAWVPGPTIEEVGLPVSVREVIGSRLGRLGEDTGRILGLAAVIGRDFDVALLSRAGDLEEDRLLDALDEATSAALIQEVAGRSDRFTFSHALVQHVLYDSLSGARRVRAHERVAAALEELCGDDPGDRVGELAHHWVAATRPVEVGRAVGYSRQAGDRALAQLAPEEAVVWYSQALDLQGSSGEAAGGAGADGADQIDLLIGLGESQRHAGQPTFRETLLQAAELARAAGDPERLVRAALANSRGMHSASGYADSERIAIYEAAAEAAGEEDSVARAQILATLAAELTYAGEDHRQRRHQLADEALAVARRLGDDAALARVLNLRFNAIVEPENAAEQMANSDEAMEVTGRLGDPFERYWALQFRLWALGTAGLIEELNARVSEFDGLAEELAQPGLRWFARFHRSWVELLVGRVAEAERLALEALQIGNDTGQPDALPVFVAQLAMIRRDQGRLDELVDTIARAVADNPGIPGFGILLALVYCELERDDEARLAFAPTASDGFASIPHDPVWSSAMTMGAEVAAILGDADAAAILGANLRPFTGMLAHNGTSTLGAIDRYLGLTAMTLGRYFEADAHFAAAVAIHTRIGAPAWLARTQVDWARMLQRRGGKGDAEQAGELLASALRTARKLGLRTVEQRAAALLQPAG